MAARLRPIVGGLLLAALLAPPARAQRPLVETFGVGNGLPSANVFDLAQDLSGRIWIATRAGVAVYDGHAFRTFGSGDGLPGRVFSALDVDAWGRTWTVSRSELTVYVFEAGAWRKTPDSPLLEDPFNWTTSLKVVSDGERVTVFVGNTLSGLAILDGGVWSLLSTADGLPHEHVTTITRHDSRILVGTLRGLCELARPGLERCEPRAEPPLREPIFALHSETRAGAPPRLWVLTPSRLGHFERGRWTLFAEIPKLERSEIPGVVATDRAGGVYYGNVHSFYFQPPSGDERQALGRRHGLLADGASALLEDRESNVWIGGTRGLTKISSRRFESYFRDQGLLENEVSAIAEWLPGRLVLGHNRGFSFLDGERVETRAFDLATSSELAAIRVLDLAVDGDGVVWAAARRNGLLRLHTGGWEVELASDVLTVEVDGGGRLWAGTHQALFVRDGGLRAVEPEIELEDFGFIRWLTAGPEGSLYVSMSRGLVWYDGARWRSARGPTGETSNVYGVLAEPGRVWAGTRAGLYELAGNELRKVARGELRIDRPIYFILRGPRGRVWFGTDDGVLIWDGERPRQLTVRHGLAGRETNRGAGLVDHRGRVWIGTDQGVSRYRERYDLPPSVAPRVELIGVEVDGRMRSASGRLELGHDDNALTFHVRTIYFSTEQDVHYRYRLEGFDRGWVGPLPATSSEIRYTNVPPGRYRFRIAAGWAGSDLWSPEATSASIAIARPLWREPWFVFLATATAVLLGLGAHRLRVRAIRNRNRELEALIAERRRAEAQRERLIQDLEAKNFELERFTYTVSHDLKSPLVTIKGFLGLLERDAERGEAKLVKRDVERIGAAADTMGQLLDELLELSRVGRVMNPPEEVALSELAAEAVALTTSRRTGRDVDVVIEPDLPAVFGDRIRLLEVFQNLIGNAIKFMGDEPDPRIEIGVRAAGGADGAGAGNDVVCTVRDNGIGIDPRYHDKVFGLFERLETGTDGTGIGLALVRRIIAFHGGRIWVESEGSGKGTIFCFTLPRADPERAALRDAPAPSRSAAPPPGR